MLRRSFRLAAVLAVPAAALALLALYLGGRVPYRVYVVHTGSMSPTIPSGSAVLVREGRYRVGQAVAVRVHGTIVTHRLVAVHADGTIDTKGDADRSIDPWHASTRDVVGEVVLAPHLAGFVLVYLGQPPGAASVLLAILLVWQTLALARSLRERPDEARPAARYRFPGHVRTGQ